MMTEILRKKRARENRRGPPPHPFRNGRSPGIVERYANHRRPLIWRIGMAAPAPHHASPGVLLRAAGSSSERGEAKEKKHETHPSHLLLMTRRQRSEFCLTRAEGSPNADLEC